MAIVNSGGGSNTAPALASARNERTSGDITGWTTTTFTDVDSNLDISLTTGAHRCLVAWTMVVENTNQASNCVDVSIDGTRQGQSLGLVFTEADIVNANASGSFLTDALTAATHTFKLLFRVDNGTAHIYGSTTAPIVFSVVELYA